MIRVKRVDGVHFDVTYPYTVTTNGDARDRRAAKAYSEEYELDLRLADGLIHDHSPHEELLADVIFTRENADEIDDSRATTFPTNLNDNGPPIVY